MWQQLCCSWLVRLPGRCRGKGLSNNIRVFLRTYSLGSACGDDSSAPPTKRPRRLPWAHLMRRVLDIDVLTCPKCAASMVIIAFITEPSVLTRILDHLKLPSTQPPLASARSPLDEQDLFADEKPTEPVYREAPGPDDGIPTARAPP